MDHHLRPFFKTKKLFPSTLAGCFAIGSFIKCLTNVSNAGHISTVQCKQFSFSDHLWSQYGIGYTPDPVSDFFKGLSSRRRVHKKCRRRLKNFSNIPFTCFFRIFQTSMNSVNSTSSNIQKSRRFIETSFFFIKPQK